MVTISIKDVRIHARHGLYPGEELTGAMFELDLEVRYNEGDHPFVSIEDTINYEQLISLVQKRMDKATGLLEKIALDIVESIKNQYPQIQEVIISVYKLNPPIENFLGKVGVTMHKIFDV